MSSAYSRIARNSKDTESLADAEKARQSAQVVKATWLSHPQTVAEIRKLRDTIQSTHERIHAAALKPDTPDIEVRRLVLFESALTLTLNQITENG